jgi:serine/threonine-protein kinase
MKQPTSAERRYRVRYEVIQPIAEGSMGVVYLARHRDFGYEVALKRLHDCYAHQPELIDRFYDEARAAETINHPGLPHYFETGRDGAGPYLVMELLRGGNLSERIEQGPIGLPESIDVARQVAQALTAAHKAGIVHRDLKPDNIYLVRDPGQSRARVKVIDFGVAKFVDEARTRIGKIFGTPLYMSPEQCQGATYAGPHSDIYSLGCVLYQLVTGQLPFNGNLHEVLHAQMCELPKRPRDLGRAIPRKLDELIMRMLAKDPAHRPQSMTDVDDALRAIQRPLHTRRGRGRRWAVAAAVVVMLGAAGASVLLATTGASHATGTVAPADGGE